MGLLNEMWQRSYLEAKEVKFPQKFSKTSERECGGEKVKKSSNRLLESADCIRSI